MTLCTANSKQQCFGQRLAARRESQSSLSMLYSVSHDVRPLRIARAGYGQIIFAVIAEVCHLSTSFEQVRLTPEDSSVVHF